MFKTVLVANRGEIAVRVLRACRETGIRGVTVASEADRNALHARMADAVEVIGPAESSQSYLSIEKVIAAAKKLKAEAIHPGYGFLSENPAFAEACEKAGIVFVGPPAAAMRLVGSKTAARRLAEAAGVPFVPGTTADLSDAQAATEAAKIGFPVMLKASAGGGGKGMRLVSKAGDLAQALERARSEAKAAFGDASVYIEKAIESPRHIEVQILVDGKGHASALGERDCSVQRRHQKLIEESPSPFVTPALRSKMYEAALAIAKASGYRNAGTVEFLVDRKGAFYFLEVNARLQVEHPVTEATTGLDLVREQLLIAAGEPMTVTKTALVPRGAAIECRLYAENPDNNFSPSPGHIRLLRFGSGPGIRVDSGVESGDEVSVHYDPLIAKIIAWGGTREQALARMRRALAETAVRGTVRTVQPFLLRVLSDPAFVRGDADTGIVARLLSTPAPRDAHRDRLVAVAAALHRFAADHAPAVARPSGAESWSSGWKSSAAQEAVERLGTE